MGKKLDKKAKAAVAKAAKGVKAAKVDKAVKKFRKLEGKLWTREYLLKIAEFDGATIAPANGAAARADAMGTLAGEHHKLLTSEKSVELVRSLARETVAGGKIDDPQLLDEIRVLGRDQREASVIPTEEAEAWTRLTCEADAVWHKAKTANDWASFEPYVDRIVAQLKHQAELMDPKRDPYDVWLDQYERGLSAKSFDAFCDEVKATVVPLVHAIGERGQQPDADFLHARVPEAAQRAMSFDLMKLVGLDLDDTTLAFTEHPFSEGFAVGDARIATHIYEDDCISNVYSIIHEAGHAMYELGVNPAYARTCLEGGTSMGIHESQSRFYENLLGRSRAFTGFVFPKLCELFPELSGHTAEEFYRAINKAEPSLIRTEADEVTYSLHVMVRYELEKRVMHGELKVHDLPGEWNRLYKEYLGVDVPDDKHGVLQDSHWSGGSIGYFPSYALGSAYGAQLLRKMKETVDVDECLKTGNFAPINAWNREHIWQYGCLKKPDALLEQALGEKFDPTVYTQYLEEKYGEIYGL